MPRARYKGRRDHIVPRAGERHLAVGSRRPSELVSLSALPSPLRRCRSEDIDLPRLLLQIPSLELGLRGCREPEQPTPLGHGPVYLLRVCARTTVCYSRLMMLHLRTWARAMKRDVIALYLAGRDPRVPWYAKLLAGTVAAYAISPIDLIPDFIPVLGYLDDLLLLPLGIYAVVKLIPPEIMDQHRQQASAMQDRPVSYAAAVAIAAVWIGLALLATAFVYRRFLERP